MSQPQTLETQNSKDAPVHRVGRDSQLSMVSQLGGADNSAARSWSFSQEPQQGQLNMQSIFSANSLDSELGIGNQAVTQFGSVADQVSGMTAWSGAGSDQAGSTTSTSGQPGDGLINMGNSLSQFGAELTAVGTDINQINSDLTNLGNDLHSLLDSLGTPGSGGAGSTDNSAGTGGIGSTENPTGTGGPGSIDTTTPTTGSPIDNTPTTTTTNPTTPNVPIETPSGTTPRTSTTPFASDSVFNMPLGSGAQWQPNSQLDSAGVTFNTEATGYNQPVYTATSGDPLVTITDNGGVDGQPTTFQAHIPAGAQPAPGSDAAMSVMDPSTNTWFSFGQFQWTGSNTATVEQASTEPLNGSGITQDGSNWDQGVGTLTQADLQAGSIDHMLRVQIPTDMAQSYSSTSTNVLAPNAWPQTAEDGFANTGGGPNLPPYSGTIPYGSTIGIPAGTPEPTDIANNAGANMLWKALQDHGAMIRDTTGNQNEGKLTFQTDQNVAYNDPLIQGMDQYGNEIMSYTQILANQGPNSINGGGTPIVPLDGPPA